MHTDRVEECSLGLARAPALGERDVVWQDTVGRTAVCLYPSGCPLPISPPARGYLSVTRVVTTREGDLRRRFGLFVSCSNGVPDEEE